MKTWNEQQRAAIRRQSKEQLARDYETFAIQSTQFMRQRDELLAALNEINNWLVCAAIATPEDMAQSFGDMQQIAAAAIAKATGATE